MNVLLNRATVDSTYTKTLENTETEMIFDIDFTLYRTQSYLNMVRNQTDCSIGREKFFQVPIYFMVVPSYGSKISKVFATFKSNGIYARWQLEMRENMSSKRAQNRVKSKASVIHKDILYRNVPPIALNKQLQSIFKLQLIMLSFACFVFVFELKFHSPNRRV